MISIIYRKKVKLWVQSDQFKSILATYTEPLVEVRDCFDLANKEKRVEELEREMEARISGTTQRLPRKK